MQIDVKRVGAALVLLLLLLSPVSRQAAAQVFLPDQPIREDPDTLDVPAPEPRALSDFYDFLANTFGSPGAYDGPALNVNTVGEVPNSSWYTNRHYRDRMSIAALQRGPDTVDGPSTAAPWRAVEGKLEGKTPGLQIVDARGDRYLLKFDPPGHPGLTSGAEVVATKFFHALGYHVPENYIVEFDAGRIVPGEEATYETPGGEEKPLTEVFIREVLARVPQTDAGRYRAVASRFLRGTPLGPFLYYGTRPDDANDIFPHEGRRELRGLRVFSAWLNHVDARSINSLDMLIEEEGRQYVRHHLIDFGSTLGAAALGPKEPWFGYEYAIDPGPIALRTLSLGFGASSWFELEPSPYPSVGLFEADLFDPERWDNQYPNAAFRRMDADDAFWAARQVMHFTDEEIRAIVETARYPEPGAAAYIAEVLARRRDKIGRAYLHHGGGLDRFRVAGEALHFDDLAGHYDFAPDDRDRHVAWQPFDNRTGEAGATLAAGPFMGTSLPIPDGEGSFLVAELRFPGQGVTRVYLRRVPTGWEVVGLQRE